MKASSLTPGKRSAAVRAQQNIRQISQAEEQFHTEDQILKASTREARRRGATTAELGQRLRSMSLTPVPTGMQNDSEDRNVSTASTKAANIILQANKIGGPINREKHDPVRDTKGQSIAHKCTTDEQATSAPLKVDKCDDLSSKEEHGSDRPTVGRTAGRTAARERNIDKLICNDSDEDLEDDLDSGEFYFRNGIILQVGQEGRLADGRVE
jgi:hypothetical protein